jgi:hypothetical protein
MPRYVYAYECVACDHLCSKHRLSEDGDLRAGPYCCSICACQVPQDGPWRELSAREYRAKYVDTAGTRYPA